MSTTVIPTRYDGTQRYRQQCTLAGARFTLEFLWNDRDRSWSMGIYDASSNLLAAKKVTLDTGMLWRYADPRLPAGELFAVDTSGAQQEPGLYDLGSRVLLTFVPAADLYG